MRRLFVTRRALCDDLHLPADKSGKQASFIEMELLVDLLREAEARGEERPDDAAFRRLRERQPILVAFVQERSQQPEGQEWTQHLPHSYKKVFNLHAGRWRGFTWWDRDRDIVWLLGQEWHSSGEPDDAYQYAVQLDARQQLMPSVDDFEDVLDVPDERFLERVVAEAPAILEEARTRPDTEIRHRFDNHVDLGVIVEVIVESTGGGAEDVFVAVQLLAGAASAGPEDTLEAILAVMLPDADYADLTWNVQLPHRGPRPRELTVRWSHYF